MKRPFLILSLSLAFFLLSGCMTMDGFLFNSEKITAYRLPGNTIPDSLIRQETFQSAGNTLYGYWVKCPADSTARPGVTILYCHGNKHNMDEYWDRVMLLHRLGVNLFIFDYRGYGLSGGASSEKGLEEDVTSARALLASKYAVPSDSDTLCVYGYSLGCFPAVYIAGLPETKANRLITESPFASANSLTQSGMGGLDIPALWLTDGKYDNAENIRKITCPYFLIHGENDDFVRWRDNGKIVYENAPDNPKELLLVPGAVHTNVPQTLGDSLYLQKLRDFLSIAPRR